MRIPIAIAVAFAALIVAGASSPAQPTRANVQPGSATIRVTSKLLSAREMGFFQVSVYAIYNRPAYPKAIGSAILTCVKAAPQATACYEYFRLARGQIVTEGLIVNKAYYRLAVTGGTGYYDNIGGTLTVRATGPGAQQLAFDLNAF